MGNNGELRAFLRTRRARVRPEDVGIEPDGRRRVPGLRREEVALPAGVSLDYYARLEQGRRRLQPSDQVLDAIARALRLPEVERLYLHNVVRSSTGAARSGGLRIAAPDDGMRLMLDTLRTPALLVDSLGDVHALNRMGQALLVGLEPLHSLIGELSSASPEFRTWWAAHDISTRCRGPKRFHHPLVGPLTLHVEALRLQDGELWLYTYSAEPGSPSEEGLQLLGSWGAPQETPSRGTATAYSMSGALGE